MGKLTAKIALINPANRGTHATIEPLNLGYIAAYLAEAGCTVKIIDQMAGDDVPKEISLFGPDIAGITSVTPLAQAAYRIADICRKRKILTVLGGPHAGALPQEALEHADIVVSGEGEKAMLDIVKNGITSGIIYSDYIQELDDLPLPARGLMQQERYLHADSKLKMSMLAFLGKNISKIRSAALISGRGCPFRCVFCPNSLRQSPVRFHSAERVLEELRQLKKDYGLQAAIFLDENFLVNKNRLLQICHGLIEEKMDILWSCATSAHFIDPQTASLIHKAGCRQVIFGLESGSQKILDSLGKSVTLEQNELAVKVCKEAGLFVSGLFMLGNPGETLKDVALTQDFIRRTQPDVFYVNITTPYPGSKLWEDYQDKMPGPRRWEDFYQNKLKVYPYTPFSRSQLGKLFLETMFIKPAACSRDWKAAFTYPRESLSWFLRHPFLSCKIAAGRYVSSQPENRRPEQ